MSLNNVTDIQLSD